MNRTINFRLLAAFTFVLLLNNLTINVYGQTNTNLSSNTTQQLTATVNSTQNDYVEITTIWTVDCRSDSDNRIELHWIGPESKFPKECRIQRWAISDMEPIGFSIITDSLQPTEEEYIYIDRNVDDDVVYRYKVWLENSLEQWISVEVFTVPPPVLNKWWDWRQVPSIDTPYYVNGKDDIVEVDQSSLSTTIPELWIADFIRFRIALNGKEDTSEWQGVNELSYMFEEMPDADATDKNICYYYVQSKDVIGNTSRWSEPKEAVLDITPPADINTLEVTPKFNGDFTKGWLFIDWEEPDDLCGAQLYSVYRKKDMNSEWEEIKTSVKDTEYKDTFEDIGINTTIYYKIGATDHVGNKREEPEISLIDSARCLLRPEIELMEDIVDSDGNKYVKTDYVEVDTIGKYDLTALVGFNVRRNSLPDTIVDINNVPFKVPLPEDEEYNIKVQALFMSSDETLKTTWSNPKSVIRIIPPGKVKIDSITNILPDWADTNKYKPWEGHIYLSWQKPTEGGEVVGYNIWRWNGSDDFVLVDSFDWDNSTINWVDQYDFNELNQEPEDGLFVLNTYTYKIKAYNFLGIESDDYSDPVSTYCNRAPENVNGEFLDENKTLWEVSWDPIKTILNVSDFQYEAICYYHPLQGDKKVLQSRINEGNNTKSTFQLDRDKIYSCEILAHGDINGKYDSTTKSEPIFCDYREPPFKSIEMSEIDIQAQPYQKGIFVRWYRYWEADFWEKENNDKELVELFQIKRYGLSEGGNSFIIFNFPKNSIEWINACFMDDSLLIPDNTYSYRIEPCYIDNYGDTLRPRGFVEKNGKHDISRIFIPKIDIIYAQGKYNDKLFFNGKNHNLIVKWYYLKEDGITKDTITSRGAASIKIDLSTNADFDSTLDPPSYATKTTPACDTNDSLVTTIEFTNIDSFQHNSNAPYFIQISAFDNWNNKHGYTTKYEDGDFKVYNDSTSPPKSLFKSIISKADTSSEKGKIQLRISWDQSTEDSLTQSGIRYYHLNRYNNGELIKHGEVFNADTTIIMDFPNLTNENLLDYYNLFQIIPEDLVGNCAIDPDIKDWYPIPPPKLLKVNPVDGLQGYAYEIEWSPVTYFTDIDSYYVEWNNKKNLLGDYNNRTDTTLYEIVPGSQTSLIKTQNAFKDSLFYFHVHARIIGKNKIIQESGWSNIISINDTRALKYELAQMSEYKKNIPLSFNLKQNYPNPFNSMTKIEYWMPKAYKLKIKIYNIIGKEIITLVNEVSPPGIYYKNWDGTNTFNQVVASGIYLIVMDSENYHNIMKCILLR